jgi:ElaB/YqjD/DUF883 family membrane-anchored ribosome-binding protein
MSNTEQLERDTERTRLELAHTIDELRDRLTPGQVLDEVLDYASDGDVGDYLRSFKRQMINNPLPLGLMGASMAWLVAASAFGRRGEARMRRGDSRMMRERGARKARDFAARAPARVGEFAEGAQTIGTDLAQSARVAGADFAGSARATGADLAESARATGAEFAESARATGADIADNARSAVHDIRDRAAEWRTNATDRAAGVAQDAREMAARASDRMLDAASTASANIAERARGSTEAMSGIASEIGRNSRAAGRAVTDFAHEQPLIVAAAGLVLGAIIGALLPSTETEDRLIGESSDAAKEKLRQIAGEQYAKAKDVAMRTADAALGDHPADSPSHENAHGRESTEFAPGPGGHDGTEHPRDDHPIGVEEAERTHADGG